MLGIENRSVRDGLLLGVALYLVMLSVAVLHDHLHGVIANEDARAVIAGARDVVRALGIFGIALFGAGGALLGAIPWRRLVRGNVPPEGYWR